jgi:hypothetical protein
VAGNFDELLEDCRVGQEMRERRERAATGEALAKARRAEQQALAQNKPELAMKIESHRLQFERQLAG